MNAPMNDEWRFGYQHSKNCMIFAEKFARINTITQYDEDDPLRFHDLDFVRTYIRAIHNWKETPGNTRFLLSEEVIEEYMDIDSKYIAKVLYEDSDSDTSRTYLRLKWGFE